MVVAVSGIVPTSATLCAGSSNTFSITIAPPGETLPGDPAWTVTPAAAGSIIGSGTSVVFVAANTGVVATVTAGCGSSSAAATVTILTNHWSGWTVSNAPSISLTVSGEVASCAITTVTFTAAISTNNGLRYRSDMNGCAPTNEVSDLVLTNLVTTWNVTGPNAASGSGTQAMFTVSNPGTNMITFTTIGETLDPAGTYSTDAVATNVSYSLTLTPLDTNTCVHCTNVFVATAAPAGSGTFTWNPAGVVTYSPDGTTSSNAVVFTTAGLAQLVNVTYGACSQTATVNVFEVTGVAWEAINSPLTPNDHPSGTVGVKMFPDKNTPTDTVERRTVRVVATVNPPTNGIPIYFRLFDVDDPSTNAAPVDTNDSTVETGDDNRSDGTSVPAGGLLIFDSASTVLSNGQATASVVLTVSRQPGNNFRVAASCDPNALARLTVTNNVPDTLYVPGSDAAVSGFTGQITPLLTVWRRLHLELDSMAAVTGNFISGAITNVGGGTTSATILYVNQNLADGSPMLSTGNGRFENGVVAVGAGGGATNLVVEANGASSIRNLVTGLFIPFRITKPGRPDVTGNLRLLEPGTASTKLTLNVTGGHLTGAYKDGTINVAGVTATIIGVNPGQSLVTVPLGFSLPFTVHDDDTAVLPLDLVNSGFTNRLLLAFAPTYLQPIVDGGGNAAHNRLGVPFVRNLPRRLMISDVENFIQVTDGIQSDTHRADDFWVVYGLVAFQSTTATNADMSYSARADADPDGETALGGVNSAFGGIGAVVFIEDCVEFIRQGLCGVPANVDFTTFVEGAMLHELGHQFNLGHPPSGVMGCDFWQANAGFVPSDLACIRGQPKSPGRRTEGVTPETPFGVPCN